MGASVLGSLRELAHRADATKPAGWTGDHGQWPGRLNL
jgi:hypothetical protein